MARAATKVRPYKDFLTPALHRRFVAALSVCLAVCHLESIIIGAKNSSGIRTSLLFLSILCIFLLRVSQLHVGIRTSFSRWSNFKTHAFKFQTIQTMAWYCTSAYLFSEICIWSAPGSADLSRVKLIPRTNRTILNEKPIYFTSFFSILAISQAIIHLLYDYDRINIPAHTVKDSSAHELKSITPIQQLKSQLPALVRDSIKRRFAWSFNRSWAKIFWILPRSNSMPTTWPFHWSLLWKTTTSGFLLVMLWETGNLAFSVYSSQEPLKNGLPITHESRDPIGSLLTGLRANKFQTRVFAFWELVNISRKFKSQRKSIFEDIDRSGGSSWSQIRDACLNVITEMMDRINDYEKPITPPITTNEDIPSLPRLSEPLRDSLLVSGDIFQNNQSSSTTSKELARNISKFAKSRRQFIQTETRTGDNRLAQGSVDGFFVEKQRQLMSKSGFDDLIRSWATRVLQTNLGRPFRQEYRQRIATVVLGTPYGDVGVIIDAIESIANLTVCSLTEDQYGNVQRDVKLIIQTFVSAITTLDRFKSSMGRHWTDTMSNQISPEVDQIIFALCSGLSDVLEAFKNYIEDVGLSLSELKHAKDSIAKMVPQSASNLKSR
ncbi:nuclear envelope protein [Blumeria hordei DH14]|uniref:Nuclear envelope protein n=1 Tax=Blumeria graminis f. sp. hordei (strain DH14) TaxID=546991 RepID=N1JIZ1_BLUG1|nr:nuclear envelope protein [Blumeria hordei DH14]